MYMVYPGQINPLHLCSRNVGGSGALPVVKGIRILPVFRSPLQLDPRPVLAVKGKPFCSNSVFSEPFFYIVPKRVIPQPCQVGDLMSQAHQPDGDIDLRSGHCPGKMSRLCQGARSVRNQQSHWLEQ